VLGVLVTNDGMRPDATSPVSAEDWRGLSAQESDVVAVLDADGVCTWTSGAAWVGRSIRDLIVPDDGAVIDVLLGSEPRGPLWIRRPESTGEISWMHVVSVPRAQSGWVLQIREARQVDVRMTADATGLDSVTGLVGREQALTEVAFLLAATPRTGREIAVACCGLDSFGELNDRLGRDACDEVLRVVAGRIGDTLRVGDFVARLDSDRFLLILRGVHHLRGSIRVANKVRAVVEDPIPLATGEIEQTMSIGVTIISRGESVDSVLERAEGALAMAKDAGRNLVMSSPPI
jgi:diguanylate cyclase (GGDEF)-like protein